LLDFPTWKRWGTWLAVLLISLLAVPSFLPAGALKGAPFGLDGTRVSLGLDLQGGSHIMLEANEADVTRGRLETLEESVRAELREAEGGRIAIEDMGLQGGRLSVQIRNPGDLDRAVEALRRLSQPAGGLSGQRDFDVSVVDGTRILVAPTAAGARVALNDAMTQTVEVIRRRIDELGTREPTIIRQGSNRVVVQVPGLQDPTALKALIGKTAKLEFKLVDMEADPAELAAGRAPPGSQVLPSADAGGAPIAVKRRVILTGDQLIDAQQSFQDGQPVVNFRFDGAGARRFARITQENTGKPFAIILDGTVISAPRINEPILGGNGIISGSFTTQSANELAILLRSGRLPVELTVVEERTVGPDLGRDSIRAGALASIVSTVAVAIFIIATYGRFGLYAVIGLVLNIFMILGVLAATGATLTLPGIAGLVLTIGAAVDANVLINERIREEARRGRGVVQAVEAGYREASRAIFDANITNVIAAAVMFFFGSGPIKGFGIVLMIGIVTSVFTAVTFTRLLVADWLRGARREALVL
jgi:preprotein translocase subunit SecD